MKALVATINHILLVDLAAHTVQPVETGPGHYYGISWWENSEYPVLGHSFLRAENVLALEDPAAAEKGYLSFGPERSPSFLTTPHQVLCAPNGWVLAANTGRNRVTIYDRQNGMFKDLKTNSVNWDRMGDDLPGEHFNSVYIRDNRLFVLAHGWHKLSYVLEYAFPSCEFIAKHPVRHRCGLHNIWVDDAGSMISCHSASGALIEIKSGETLWRGPATYTRGLAVTSDLILVGDSEIAMHADRNNTQCGIWIINRNSLRTMDYIPLGPYGACHEIRVLDVPDEAHHGRIFRNIDWLEKRARELDAQAGARRDDLRRRRKQMLKSQQLLQHNEFDQRMHFIIGSTFANERGWLRPRDEYVYQKCVTAISKAVPASDCRLSLEYTFLPEYGLKEQHLSLIFGYQGSHDKNMLAVFLHYTEQQCCHLYLLKNTNGEWKSPEILIPRVFSQGRLEVARRGNQLHISCNESPVIEKTLAAHELEGDVGVRCQGSWFRNFSVVEI